MRFLIRTLVLVAACTVCAHAADAPEKNYTLNLAHGVLPAEQRTIKVEKGDALRLRVTSDTAGELHLHGYRLALTLAAGQTGELAFKAYATGRYPFEWHPAGVANTGGARHAPPLAVLEVRPK